MSDAMTSAIGDLVSDISEDCYCAGWMHGIEFDLWAVICGDATDYAGVTLADHRVQALARIARDADGWVRYGDSGVESVDSVTWAKMYAAYKEGASA